MKITVSELKNYYETYYKNMALDEIEIENELKSWKYYRDKIINNDFIAEDYNSKNSNFEGKDYRSLRNFIENETNEVGSFGAMISGKLVLLVKGTGDSKEYFFRVKDKNGKYPSMEASKLTGDEEIQAKTEEMRKFLLNVINDKKDLDSLIEYFNNENEGKTIYDSIRKNFIEKVIIFNSMIDDTKDILDYHNKLIFIYDFSNLATVELMEGKTNLFEVLQSNENNLKKNKEITEKVLRVLGIENPTYFDLVRIERMLWSLYKNEDRNLLLSRQKKNIIFYGAPGTGKTYIVKQILDNKNLEDLKENNSNENDELEDIEEKESKLIDSKDIVTRYVQFHPSFTYEDFIEGIKPLGIDNNGNLKLGVVNGCFKEFCMLAKANPKKEFYFVADEINRCNLSSVFGETLSLLENDYRWSDKKENLLQTPLSKVIESIIDNAKNEEKEELIKKYAFVYKNNHVYFGIPQNIHFIGMMNDCDKSIDSFDLALRRRFIWVRKEFDDRVLYLNLLSREDINDKNINLYVKACKKLNAFITGEDYGESIGDKESLRLGKTFEIGHAIFMKIKDLNSKNCKAEREEIWNEHLEPVVKEYLRSSYLESDIDSKLKEARDLFLEN